MRRGQKERDRAKRLRRYGLSEEEFAALVAAHPGCGICGGPPRGRWKEFHIDHDHATKKVRGLLCDPCNRGIGFLKDNPDILQRAISYLSKVKPE